MSGGPRGPPPRSHASSRVKGELVDWQNDLNSAEGTERQKDAMKKIIATMTIGKDVSPLFSDVVKCSQTNNIELKKLVYLYIINYAKTQEDQAVMAVNTFVQDARDYNPLVRALAVRTMSCIRVEKVIDHIADPLMRACDDSDPYVRKTAAIAIAKLFDANPELVESRGLLDKLKDMLSDANHMVIANAVAALADISARSSVCHLVLDRGAQAKLFLAVNECSEWGQIFILDALSSYEPHSGQEAKEIAERVLPRLQHSNAAVVLAAIKLVMKCIQYMDSQQEASMFCSKMTPPLVTLLLSAEPEIKYVALRNIDLIIQKQPAVLDNELKVFFCKFNDPIFVKLEKLEIMIKLANEHNVNQVLLEFKEYAQEVDMEFVRKSVRSIGRLAIKLAGAARRCVDVLLELIHNKVNYVIQEAIIVIKDIFRKYPNEYENIITTLCENLDELDEPEAKASMIWIIGEYSARIDNADELLSIFADTFEDEVPEVQLQILTAVVKLFLEKPESTQEMAERILTLCTTESDNPDLRDRGYMYFRLVSEHESTASEVVLCEKPEITDDTNVIDPSILDSLVENIGSLASVYHKPPEMFVPDYKAIRRREDEYEEDEDSEDEVSHSQAVEQPRRGGGGGGGGGGSSSGTVDIFGDLGSSSSSQSRKAPPPATSGGANTLDDLFAPPPGSSSRSSAGGSRNVGGGDMGDFFGGGSSAAPAGRSLPQNTKSNILPTNKGNGLSIDGAFNNRGGEVFLDLTLRNLSEVVLANFAMSVNKNPYGLTTGRPLGELVPSLMPGTSLDISIPFIHKPESVNPNNKADFIQLAVKNNSTDKGFYFGCPLDLMVLFSDAEPLEKKSFIRTWKSVPEETEALFDVPNVRHITPDALKSHLEKYNVKFVAEKRTEDGSVFVYFSVIFINDFPLLVEMNTNGTDVISVALRAENPAVCQNLQGTFTRILQSRN